MIVQHYLIMGVVQGVGYRVFAKKAADKFGLRGWTRNLQDGQVEIVAQGGAEELSSYHQELLRGPRHSQVDAIRVKEVAHPQQFEGFLIKEDGAQPWFDDSP